MDDELKRMIRDELMALTRAPRKRSRATAPMTFLKECCPNLLALMRDAVASHGLIDIDVEDLTEAVLTEVTCRATVVEVQQAGDLLGLTVMEEGQLRRIFDDYKKDHRSDAPEKPYRYGMQTRQIIAASRNGLSITTNANKGNESTWMQALVDALSVYLRNEDDQLLSFARQQGYAISGDVARLGELPYGLFRSPELDTTGTPYVHRPDIENQFHELVEGGAKLIAFVGFAGMGKTSLAETFASAYSLVRCDDGKPHLGDLKVALKKSCPDSREALTTDNVLPLLAELLSADPGPRVVVLDNLQSTDELTRLVPRNTVATVLATCRESGTAAPPWCEEIQIDTMTEVEATSMAKLLSPTLSDDDAKFLAEASGGYPLMVTTVCGGMNLTKQDVRTLCRSFQIEPGDIRTVANERLHDIVGLMLSALRAVNPVAVEILACAVTFHDQHIVGSMDALYHFILEQYGADAGPRLYAQAMRALRRAFLIAIRPSLDSDDVSITIHPAIRAIVCDLLRDVAATVDSILRVHLMRLLPAFLEARRDEPPSQGLQVRYPPYPGQPAIIMRVMRLLLLAAREQPPLVMGSGSSRIEARHEAYGADELIPVVLDDWIRVEELDGE